MPEASPGLARHEAAKTEAHGNFVEAAVEVLQQALAETQVWLAAGKQVLHDGRKPRAAPGELHHARRHRGPHEFAEEDTARQARAELEIGGEIAPQQAVVQV